MEITSELLYNTILPKMFKMVNLPNDEESIKKYIKKDGWYATHFWTSEQQDEFIHWLTELFKRKLKCNKDSALNKARWFNLMYGWMVK